MSGKREKSLRAYGGFILTFEPGRAEWLAERLSSEIGEMALSQSFSSRDWEMEQRELMFLMFHEQPPMSIGAFVLMERMRGTGGFATLKMRFAQMLVFDEPLPLSLLQLEGLDERLSTPGEMKRLDECTWAQLFAQIKDLRRGYAARLDDIATAREAEHRLLGDSVRAKRLNEQRDALGLALDIGLLDRASIFKSIHVQQADQANSILALLAEATPVHERSMLEHDRRIFELLLGVSPDRTVLFEDGREHSVRVLVTDQTDLETVLGTDLIIYSARHESFLLLQYKRMEKDENGWSYAVSPSSNVHQQLDQMLTFQARAKKLPSVPPSLWSYRLNGDPCYFKFCEQFRPNAEDASLIPGITISAVHLREFLTLPEAKGKRGGISVGYRNCPRYLNNTEFVQLAQSGWIGGGPQAATLLQAILQANKEGGSSAMLAVIDGPRDSSASGRGWKAKS